MSQASKSSHFIILAIVYVLGLAFYYGFDKLLLQKIGIHGHLFGQVFIFCIIPMLVSYFMGNGFSSTFPFKKSSWYEVLAVMAISVAAMVLIYWLSGQKMGLTRSNSLKYWLFFILVPIFFEEFFFRGFFYSMLSSLGKFQCILATTMLYTLAHLNHPYWIYYLLTGLLLAGLREYKNNLVLPLLGHLFIRLITTIL